MKGGGFFGKPFILRFVSAKTFFLRFCPLWSINNFMATLKASSLMLQFLIAAQNLSYIALLTLTVILSSTFLGKIFYSKFAFIAEMTVVFVGVPQISQVSISLLFFFYCLIKSTKHKANHKKERGHSSYTPCNHSQSTHCFLHRSQQHLPRMAAHPVKILNVPVVLNVSDSVYGKRSEIIKLVHAVPNHLSFHALFAITLIALLRGEAYSALAHHLPKDFDCFVLLSFKRNLAHNTHCLQLWKNPLSEMLSFPVAFSKQSVPC